MEKRCFTFTTQEWLHSAETFFKCADYKTSVKGLKLTVEGESGEAIEGLFERYAQKYSMFL